MKFHFAFVWENTTPSAELPRDFCAGIGPLHLGVVLVLINVELYELPHLDISTATYFLRLSN